MIADLTNHLWQSTLFVLAVALLAAALHNNCAHVRYQLWFAASLKFFVPFSFLIDLGAHLRWVPVANRITAVALPVLSPLSSVPTFVAAPTPAAATRTAVDWVHLVLVALWAAGFVAIALLRLRSWQRIRVIVRTSTPLTTPHIPNVDLHANIQLRSSSGLLEPGVVGLWRPILLLPKNIEERLSPPQLHAVLVHELCHIRRRDNLTAAIHMLVEAVFWFHPLVWWIGARLVSERERACDEHVLQVFQQPQTYAEGILNVCRLYVESPLTCVSGVTGSANIKRRIEYIMQNRVGVKLNVTKKAILALTATVVVATPVSIGMLSTPLRAQTTELICAESDPAVRLELQSADDKILQVDGVMRDQKAGELAQELVDRHPDDFIVHIRFQQWTRVTRGTSALVERYRALAASHPGNPTFTVLYAQALRETNVPQAIGLLKNLAPGPLDPWVHLTLAELHSSRASVDVPEVRTHLNAWFGACATTPNWAALSTLVAYGSPETAAKEAAVLRSELESETDPHLLLSWQFVWALESKARPEAEHAALRQQIALDVAQLETIPPPADLRWPALLTAGHNLAADPKPR